MSGNFFINGNRLLASYLLPAVTFSWAVTSAKYEKNFIFSASYCWTSKNADIFYTESNEILLWNLAMKSYVLENCGKEWNFLRCKQIWVCVFNKMADKIRRQDWVCKKMKN